MTHYPKRRRWLGLLPDRCACGAGRFDRCPDAIADVHSGSGGPRGGSYPGLVDRKRGDQGRSSRTGSRWAS
jgi:hypothetical protein